MALFLTFSSISSLSFQKKRRRKGVGEEVFSLSFLFLSLFFFRRKRREEELLFPSFFLPLGEEISLLFFLFFFFFRRKRRKKKDSFFFFSLSLSGRRNLFLSSLLLKRKREEKNGRKKKGKGEGERKNICPFGKVLIVLWHQNKDLVHLDMVFFISVTLFFKMSQKYDKKCEKYDCNYKVLQV